MYVTGTEKGEVQPCPTMAWLLHHSPSNTNVIFDLGLRKDITHFPPGVQDRIKSTFTIEVKEDVYDSLRAAKINPQTDINTVILSHLHFDHIGDPRHFGPHTQFVMGPNSFDLIQGPNNYPANADSTFNSELFPHGRSEQLPSATDYSFGNL